MKRSAMKRTARNTRMLRIAVGTALVAIALPLGSAAGADTKGDHCVVYVEGQEQSGEYIVSAPDCYPTLSAAMESVGLGTGVSSISKASQAMAAASMTIGIHYDGAFSGASFSVVGADCNGGYLNMSSAWNDRVSSSISNNCGRIRHWTDINKAGSWQDTLPNGTLSSPVNNAVSSIQYLN